MSREASSGIKILWSVGDYDWDNSMLSTGNAGARIYRIQDFVTVEAVHYDHEDNREYYSRGRFTVLGFKRALEEMESHGRGRVTENGDCLLLIKSGEFADVELSTVPYPANTPGGARIFSTSHLGKIPLEKLRVE